MKVAIIGCGLIGLKRAASLGDATLVACADLVLEKAKALASRYKDCHFYSDYSEMLASEEVDVVIIATLHSTLAEIADAAVMKGRHVLIEKPAGRRAAELADVIRHAEEKGVLVRVGFNHRYHRAFRKARELVDAGELGDLMFIRARYGHGGRIGYDKEWRSQPELSGGGELIDQGVHLIDLARWFLGDFEEVHGFAHTYYWDMPVDDNGFLILKTAAKQVAHLHASCTEWKNTFSFELYGKKGKIDINGLGGSYGVERIAFYKMLPEMGPPETFVWEYPMADDSWHYEFKEFLEDINQNRQPAANVHDAQAALKIVEEIYRISRHDSC